MAQLATMADTSFKFFAPLTVAFGIRQIYFWRHRTQSAVLMAINIHYVGACLICTALTTWCHLLRLHYFLLPRELQAIILTTLLLAGHVTLTAVIGSSFLGYCFKSTHCNSWLLRIPDPQMACRDLNTWQGITLIVSVVSVRWHAPFRWYHYLP